MFFTARGRNGELAVFPSCCNADGPGNALCYELVQTVYRTGQVLSATGLFHCYLELAIKTWLIKPRGAFALAIQRGTSVYLSARPYITVDLYPVSHSHLSQTAVTQIP